MPGPRVPAHGVGEVAPGDRTGQRSALPEGAGMRDGLREVLEQTQGLGERTLHDPVRQLERVLHAARDLALGLWPECEAVGTWQAQGNRTAGSGRATVRPRQPWPAPDYATATVGRIGDGRVSLALRRRRHNLLNGVTVGTRIDPDFPPGFRLHASKSHGFIVHWALWRLLRGCHVTPLLPLQFCRCHQGAFQRGTRDYQNRVARFIEPGG